MERVKLWDKEFEKCISYETITGAIKDMAEDMRPELEGKNALFICILNGSFMFASDLMKELELPDSEISFLKLSSYQGTGSTGKVKELIGLNENLKGRNVVVLEDIIDSGHTIVNVVKQLKSKEVSDVKVASLLFKPDAVQTDIKPDYTGLEISNDFIVGYGLDYDRLGRNLKDIYKLSEDRVDYT
jgi:hypoxanthine phosphoribosyltransferase